MSLCYVCCPGTPRLEQMRNVREFISPKVVEVSPMFIWFPSPVTVLMNFYGKNVNYLHVVKMYIKSEDRRVVPSITSLDCYLLYIHLKSLNFAFILIVIVFLYTCTNKKRINVTGLLV